MYNYITPAIELGLIEMTIPDKPTSRLQKYRLTQAGHAVLKKLSGVRNEQWMAKEFIEEQKLI